MKAEIKERWKWILDGEVPQGYKKTKVGIIPREWEVKEIRDVATIKTGSTPPTKDLDNYGKEYLFVSPLDLGYKKYITYTEKKLSKKGFNASRTIPQNSVLFTCIGSTIGKMGIASCILTTNQQINSICPNSSFDFEYLYYILYQKRNKIKRLAGEQAVPQINKTHFGQTKIPLPPLPEQNNIATILSTWDKAIDLKEELIEQKKLQKKWLMQNLLTGKVRLPEFDTSPVDKAERIRMINDGRVPEGYKKTKVGIIPEKWEIKKLNEIGFFSKGKNITLKETVSKGLPTVLYGDLYTKYDSYFTKTYHYISEDKSKKSTRVKTGDLLFTTSGETAEEIGKCSCYLGKEPIYIGGDIIKLTPYSYNSLFLGYQQNSYVLITKKAQLGQGYSVVHIYQSHLEDLEIPLPPIPEQQAIANILSTADKEIGLLEKEVNTLKKQKKGLMQLLLTGIVRTTGMKLSSDEKTEEGVAYAEE